MIAASYIDPLFALPPGLENYFCLKIDFPEKIIKTKKAA